MAYFKHVRDSEWYNQEWQELINYFRNEWEQNNQFKLQKVTHPIEAKALAILSIARRLNSTAWDIGNPNWKAKFVVALPLLFPMIELIGHARVGEGDNNANLAAGIEWLMDTNTLPTKQDKDGIKQDDRRISKLGDFFEDHDKRGPRVNDLFFIRNYFIHGLRFHGDQSHSMSDMMNYELPKAIVLRGNICISEYWKQLINDDGTRGWVDRLAKARIEPFIVQGLPFEYGLIDPSIVEYLDVT